MILKGIATCVMCLHIASHTPVRPQRSTLPGSHPSLQTLTRPQLQHHSKAWLCLPAASRCFSKIPSNLESLSKKWPQWDFLGGGTHTHIKINDWSSWEILDMYFTDLTSINHACGSRLQIFMLILKTEEPC